MGRLNKRPEIHFNALRHIQVFLSHFGLRSFYSAGIIFNCLILNLCLANSDEYKWQEICHLYLQSQEAAPLPRLENRWFSLLHDMLTNGIITDPKLSQFMNALNANSTLVNPLSEQECAARADLGIYYTTIQSLITESQTHKDWNPQLLYNWLLRLLAERQKAQEEQSRSAEHSRELYRTIKFIDLKGGPFVTYAKVNSEHITASISHNFQVMDTNVTQNMWIKTMGENPSFHQSGIGATGFKTKDSIVWHKGDHPVENMTIWSAMEFANRFSIEKGLAPTYDLSAIQFKPGTSAEDGTLAAIDVSKAVKALRINAPLGNIYAAQGYRLPTEAELVFLMRLGGATSEKYPFKDDAYTLNTHSVNYLNSGSQTAEVASKLPSFIQGQEIYDLLGNVFEISSSVYSHHVKAYGENYTGPKSGSAFSCRGGGFRSDEIMLAVETSHSIGANDRRHDHGFRLVRSLSFPNRIDNALGFVQRLFRNQK